MLKLAVASAAAALLPAAAAAPTRCCAYGGSGTATLFGHGAVAIAPNAAGLYSIALGASPLTNVPFVAVLVGVDPAAPVPISPETAEAGWMITGPGTAQTLTFWTNNTADGTIQCHQSGGGPFVPDFAFCGGSGLFPSLDVTTTAGSVTLNAWAGAGNASYAVLTTAADGCGVVTVLGQNSPLGYGAFSVSVQAGNANAPPPSWAVPPSACGF